MIAPSAITKSGTRKTLRFDFIPRAVAWRIYLCPALAPATQAADDALRIASPDGPSASIVIGVGGTSLKYAYELLSARSCHQPSNPLLQCQYAPLEL